MSELFPTIDEFECPHYKCKNCKFYKPTHKGGCNRRFDHTKMEYEHPFFVSSPEENGPICNDFEPDGLYKCAMKYWHGIAHYREWLHKQQIEDWVDAGLSDEMILNKLNGLKQRDYVGFELKQKPNVRYYVHGNDYRNGTMFEGNKLKAVKMGYYKIKNRMYHWYETDCAWVVIE